MARGQFGDIWDIFTNIWLETFWQIWGILKWVTFVMWYLFGICFVFVGVFWKVIFCCHHLKDIFPAFLKDILWWYLWKYVCWCNPWKDICWCSLLAPSDTVVHPSRAFYPYSALCPPSVKKPFYALNSFKIIKLAIGAALFLSNKMNKYILSCTWKYVSTPKLCYPSKLNENYPISYILHYEIAT